MVKGSKMTDEQRKRVSEGHKGHLPTHTEGSPGFIWYNNGEKEVLVKPGTELPDGFVQGRLYQLEEARAAIKNRYEKYDLNSYRWRENKCQL